MKKRILIWALMLMLIVSLIPPAVSAAETRTISASDVSGCQGSIVQVDILISGNTAPGIVGAELKGNYDATKLEFISFSNGEIMSGPFCNTADGRIYISWEDSLTSGIVGDGIMGTLTFRISDECTVGDKISIDLSAFSAFDTDYNDITFRPVNGEVLVKDHTWSTPTYTWSSDFTTCTASRNQTCDCGGTETETVASVKTEENEQITYTARFESSAFEPQVRKVAVGAVNVTFRLIGATKSENSEYVTWISTKSYTMESGDTVYDLIQKALSDAGLGYEMSAYYLSAVDAPAALGGYSLAELDNGPRSGWMFTVNGKHGSLSIGEQVLENGDAIIVHYVNDYVYEQDSFPWLNAPDVEPTKPENPPTEPTDPSESTAPTEPTDPSESTAPTEPVDTPTQPSDTPESTAPVEPTPPTNNGQVTGDDDPCQCLCCRRWWLILLCGIVVSALVAWGTPKIIDRLKEYGAKENPAVESPEEAFAEETAEAPIDESAQEFVEETAEPSTDETAQAPAEEATQELAEEVSQESTEEAVQKVTDKDDVGEK